MSKPEVENCITCRFGEVQFGYKMAKHPWEKRYWLYFNCYRFPGCKVVFGEGCGEYEIADSADSKKEDHETYRDILKMHEEMEEPPCK